jgi:hypothetical protein
MVEDSKSDINRAEDDALREEAHDKSVPPMTEVLDVSS